MCSVCVCVGGVSGHSVTTWEENNTINHCSWNISFLKDHEPYWWSELECIFTPAILFIALVMAAEWSGLLIFTHCNVVLIVVIKNWTIEAANRAWRFLLRVKKKTQTSNYLWERASQCPINIQCVLMFTCLVLKGPTRGRFRIFEWYSCQISTKIRVFF